MNLKSNLDVSIVYVNYNTQKLLEDSLKSLVSNIGSFRFEVIIVDNNSDDFSEKEIIKIYPKAKFVKLNKNIGFGQGNNAGVKYATGKYIWLLNTDTLIKRNNNIEMIINFLDNHPSYAAATPALMGQDGEYQLAQVDKFPNIFRVFTNKLYTVITKLSVPTQSIARKIFRIYDLNTATDVEQAVAAALFLRKSVYDEIGGFGNKYFMFYEDTDLCKKISEDGYKIRYIPEACVIHLQGQSIKSDYERKKLYFKSQDIYFSEWQNKPSQLIVKLFRQPLVFYYFITDRKRT